ncbi:MAG: DUF1559 domain-containing protein, partial [Gemmataceae bacterium]|nr:DUF1559 domain-containing protein [Gemmataceae bacterium]
RYVPADAAVFAHADVAGLSASPIGKGVRAADPKLYAELTGKGKALFGLTPDDLKTVTVFMPKIQGPQDAEAVGVVLTFADKFDKAKLSAGLEETVGAGQFALHFPADRTAVVLLGGLGDDYAKPRPAGEAGPLAAALKEAAAGKHLLVAGANLANLPAAALRDDLPPDFRPFKPLLQADTVVGLVGLDKDFTVEVRVTADQPAGAEEAGKALRQLADLLRTGVGRLTREVEPDAGKDPALRDVLAFLRAADAGLAGATYTTDGKQTRVVARVPADLPFGGAFTAGTRRVREASARMESANNLKQIGIAMHNYADAHGSFPPAAITDKDGKPLLSWRVALLPYIEQDALYRQFKLDEPWDSEHNKPLSQTLIKTYTLPDQEVDPKNPKTHYRVFFGRGAAFELAKGVKFPADFQDGTSQTVLAVTAAEAVPWAKPDELVFDPDGDMRKLLKFGTGDVCMIAICDGSVRAVKKTIDPRTLTAAITRNGGEVLGQDW